MLARLRASIKTVAILFDRHQEAINRASDLAQGRRQEYEDVRKTFVRIAQVARIAAKDGKLSHAPDPLPRVSTTQFVDIAQIILKGVVPYADVLEDYGFPAHVLHELPRRLAALDHSNTDRWLATNTHSAANDAIRRVLREGDDAVVALMTNLSQTPGVSPRIVAELREARRVGRPRTVRPRRARRVTARR